MTNLLQFLHDSGLYSLGQGIFFLILLLIGITVTVFGSVFYKLHQGHQRLNHLRAQRRQRRLS